MGQHKKKRDQTGNLTRVQRQFLTRALHEAAHAVVSEYQGTKIEYAQIFTEEDSTDRKVMKMSGAGGWVAIKSDKGFGLMSLAAAFYAELMADFTDKNLVYPHATADVQMIKEVLSKPPSKEGEILDRSEIRPGVPAFEVLTLAMLHRPSVKQAILEVADFLVQHKRIEGEGVRKILADCLVKCADLDEENGFWACVLTDQGLARRNPMTEEQFVKYITENENKEPSPEAQAHFERIVSTVRNIAKK